MYSVEVSAHLHTLREVQLMNTHGLPIFMINNMNLYINV